MLVMLPVFKISYVLLPTNPVPKLFNTGDMWLDELSQTKYYTSYFSVCK